MKTKHNHGISNTAMPMVLKEIIGLHTPVVEEKPALPASERVDVESNQDQELISDWNLCPWFEKLIIAREQNSRGINH